MIKQTKDYVLSVCLGFLLVIFYITTFSGSAMAGEFIDTTNNWARVNITHLQAMGICKGYGNNTFIPEGRITRAEFTKFVVYAAGENEEAAVLARSSSPFSDVSKQHWANGYIYLAEELGLVKGQGNVFLPDQYISREEAAVILSRMLQDDNQKVTTDVKEFTDHKEFSAWAVKDINFACASGLLSGYPDGSFRPHENLTRAQTAELLARVLDLKGTLYQFNGILKGVTTSNLRIAIGSKDYDIRLSADARFADEKGIIEDLNEWINTRLSFNINSEGEIVFACINHEDKYLNVSVAEMEGINVTPSEPPSDGTVLSAGKWNDEGGVSQASPQLSLQTSKEAIGADNLTKEKGFSGKGAVIAIIDSGIDPINQDLQRTDANARKVIDWVNFSDEGLVNTPFVAVNNKKNNSISTSLGDVYLPPNIASVSGQYRYGLWSEEWIAYTLDFDFTGNKEKDDDILVLLVDSKQAGVYDLVFVDTNNNYKLEDEVPLRVYRDYKYSYASFPVTGDLPHGFPFVLCDISADGSQVIFGYDSNGHGTHVAGIAAANGDIDGVAPNAQLMAIKVADSAGNIDLDSTLKAVEYAVSKGANIINISLGFEVRDSQDLQSFNERINRLAQNTLICVAAGNDGPGIATVTAPGVASNTLTVGAGMNSKLWENNYGWTVESDGLWYFNSTGPSQEGTWRPDILAPGSAWSSYPVWTGNKFFLDEGTSMAAPFVSGAAALLMDGMWTNGHGFNSLMIKNAIVKSARSLTNISLVEQGHGMIDIQAAWELIRQARELEQPLALQANSNLFGSGQGIFNRWLLPGLSELQITNNGMADSKINWESKADWMEIMQKNTSIPASAARQIDISYNIPEKPGLYSGLIEGAIQDGTGRTLDILNTLVVPEKWDNNGEVSNYNVLPAGQMKRYFLKIPDQVKELNLNLKVLGIKDDLQGRVRLYIFDSSGSLYQVSDYAGCAPEGVNQQREVNISIDKPSCGIWEIVAYSSVSLSKYDKTVSDYVITAKLEDAKMNPNYIENEFIVGCGYLQKDDIGDLIDINIIDSGTMKPYQGRLLINNLLYEVNAGKAKIHSKILRESLDLSIRKVNI